ncbi:16318_t:CDS:2 [Dentiscutata erythropus]|uniref:16318_t:CDS:1 n=1 Tax=Dentiscutata erythropus TaxID=1348616 RepID=A0A9N8V9Z1_9GLOM|nr:16318_t:CDS:2 [Dentiscutata erythropus]
MAREPPFFSNIIMGEETPYKYSYKLIKFLCDNNVKAFDYSRFSQLKCIQRGSLAMVFSATFEDKVYAVKSFNNNLEINQEEYKHLTRETINLYNIDHPNIIKLYGASFNPETGNLFLVLQLADKTLRDHLKSKCSKDLYQISWDELINIAKGITNGLKHLHEKGIMHRIYGVISKLIVNERPEIVPNTPSSYIDLVEKCWSSNQNERPTLDIILSQLEELSTETINTITNQIVIRNENDFNQNESVNNSSNNGS